MQTAQKMSIDMKVKIFSGFDFNTMQKEMNEFMVNKIIMMIKQTMCLTNNGMQLIVSVWYEE